MPRWRRASSSVTLEGRSSRHASVIGPSGAGPVMGHGAGARVQVPMMASLVARTPSMPSALAARSQVTHVHYVYYFVLSTSQVTQLLETWTRRALALPEQAAAMPARYWKRHWRGRTCRFIGPQYTRHFALPLRLSQTGNPRLRNQSCSIPRLRVRCTMLRVLALKICSLSLGRAALTDPFSFQLPANNASVE